MCMCVRRGGCGRNGWVCDCCFTVCMLWTTVPMGVAWAQIEPTLLLTLYQLFTSSGHHSCLPGAKCTFRLFEIYRLTLFVRGFMHEERGCAAKVAWWTMELLCGHLVAVQGSLPLWFQHALRVLRRWNELLLLWTLPAWPVCGGRTVS